MAAFEEFFLLFVLVVVLVVAVRWVKGSRQPCDLARLAVRFDPARSDELSAHERLEATQKLEEAARLVAPYLGFLRRRVRIGRGGAYPIGRVMFFWAGNNRFTISGCTAGDGSSYPIAERSSYYGNDTSPRSWLYGSARTRLFARGSVVEALRMLNRIGRAVDAPFHVTLDGDAIEAAFSAVRAGPLRSVQIEIPA